MRLRVTGLLRHGVQCLGQDQSFPPSDRARRVDRDPDPPLVGHSPAPGCCDDHLIPPCRRQHRGLHLAGACGTCMTSTNPGRARPDGRGLSNDSPRTRPGAVEFRATPSANSAPSVSQPRWQARPMGITADPRDG
jgi:hypothetical protein